MRMWYCFVQVNLDMTDHCTTDFCIWQTICLVPVRRISSIRHMYTTDFAYDGPIFLVSLSPPYPSSPVLFIDHMRMWYCFVMFIDYMRMWYCFVLFIDHMRIWYCFVLFIDHMRMWYCFVLFIDHMRMWYCFVLCIDHMRMWYCFVLFIDHMRI